jgi:hypothetical protein
MGRGRWFRGLMLLAAGLSLTGCSLMGRRDRPARHVVGRMREAYPPVTKPTVDSLSVALGNLADTSQRRTRPVHVLAVGAGGAEGAFTAGVLVGWTKAGTRPTFDIVTGSSSGSLVGAFAFLGPKYDDKLEALVTSLSTSDLFEVRPVRYLLRDGAIASSAPMQRVLEREIDDAFLADLRQAHAEGRRLFIGTTNFETKRLVVWDVGAIASSGRPDADDLVRKIFLASATWAGLLPPVEFEVEVDGQIRREQHIDGGAASQTFVRFGPTDHWPEAGDSATGWLAGSHLYVIAGGRLYDNPTPPPPDFFGRILTGVSCLTHSLARADLCRLHGMCLASGMRFHLLSLPAEYDGSKINIMKVNPQVMRRLFDVGYRLTEQGPSWRTTPPDCEPGEESLPRGSGVIAP